MNSRERRAFDDAARVIANDISDDVLEQRAIINAPAPTYNERNQAKAQAEAKLRWSYGWSPSKRKAWIVDACGFTVIGPILSAQAAGEICRQHNNAIRVAMA